MGMLLLGMVLFLGVHSVRVVSDDLRGALIERLGAGAYKGLYSLASIAGFVLIVWGYGLTRTAPVDLWMPPVWTRHLAALLTIPAFVLLAAAYVPGTRIKAAVGHPMVLGVKVWAFAHLIANGRLADVVLFGGFLAWAVVLYIASRKRDRRTGTRYVAGPASRDVIAIVAGLGAWAAFAFWLHAALIGVRPFG
ncbi:MAG: NnrU family protein [Burkholderiales bacterium]|nr:MAG: NnrU family protein [Burkholderiales bacterium]